MSLSVLSEILVCILAGAGAGIGTGFAGLSAAVFITPMLVAFLQAPVYEAVGVALASDVLASAVSAWTYGRKGNIDLKHGRPLLISVILFAIIGSLVAFFITSFSAGDTVLGYWSIVASVLLGITFLLPKKEKPQKPVQKTKRLLLTILASGAYVGFVCGFQGTGGGMMMLFVLTTVMVFEFKHAVGTSVFIMTFTALIGAVTHFIINGMPNLSMLCICVLSTLFFARVSAVLANRLSTRALRMITGLLLTISGIIMLLTKLFL